MNQTALTLTLAALLFAGGTSAQEIYKQVMPDGTIVYSDQKPSDNAEPMRDLPTLTVVQSPKPVAAEDRPADDDAPVTNQVRYRDFSIVEPTPEQTYWNTGATMTVRAGNAQLAEGHSVRFVLDGKTHSKGQSLSMQFDEVFRGEHKVRAEVVNAGGQVLAATDPITFHMKQTSVRN